MGFGWIVVGCVALGLGVAMLGGFVVGLWEGFREK
jgi:hypothetical protein